MSPKISLNFINRTLENKGLSKKHEKKRKGVAKYMLYPVKLLEDLGKTLLQIDFIGPRYLEGSSDPLHFLSCKYVRPFKFHIFIRINSQKTQEVLNVFYTLFFVLNLPIPDIVQMDNDASFKGFIERQGCVGRVIKWLGGNGITPLFCAQNSPWNNGSVEGGNSVFDKKFWQQFHFNSLVELDLKLKEFNESYKTYLIKDYKELIQQDHNLTDPRKKLKFKNIIQSKIYLLRIVKERYNKCSVDALNQYFTLPDQFKGQFVLIEILTKSKTIEIYQEINEKRNLILRQPIHIDL